MNEADPILLAVDGREAIIMRDIPNVRLKDLEGADHMWEIRVLNGSIEVESFQVSRKKEFISEL